MKHLSRSLILFCLTTFLTSIASAENKLTPVTVEFCGKGLTQYLYFAYGIEKGIFAAHGIDLKMKGSKSCDEMNTSLRAGSARFGVSEPLNVAIVEGKRDQSSLIAIAEFLQGSFFCYVAPVDRGIKTPKDFKGRRVGVLQGGRDQMLLTPFLRANGLSPSDVTVVAYPDLNAKYNALVSGEVDLSGHVTTEVPNWTQRSGKEFTVMRVGSYGLPLPGDGLFIDKTKMTDFKDRQLNCEMIRATAETWAATNKEPLPAADALLRANPSSSESRELVAEGWRRIDLLAQLRAAMKKPFGYTLEEDWLHVVNLMKDQKLAPRIAAPKDYFTNQFVDGSGCNP